MSVASVLRDAETRMKKSVESAAQDFATLRTGRANPALLDALKVDYYGQQMPVAQLGTITASDARMLVIQAWDKGAVQAIEKAIQKSELGLTPAIDGTNIRLSIPPLTEQRRKDFVRQLHQKAEGGRISIRNIRRDAIDHLKKDDEVTEDEEKRAEKDVQKLLDKYIHELDTLAKSKEAELLEV